MKIRIVQYGRQFKVQAKYWYCPFYRDFTDGCDPLIFSSYEEAETWYKDVL